MADWQPSLGLFHFSQEPAIGVFHPRPAPSPGAGQSGDMVWAVDHDHQHNYLFPRDCPRVSFYAAAHSDPADVDRLIGPASARVIIAIESAWLDRVRSAVLTRYAFPPEGFTCIDAGAGYWISRESVEPTGSVHLDDLLSALLACDVELRITRSLWPLSDAVVASTLGFSCIRMRNAVSR